MLGRTIRSLCESLSSKVDQFFNGTMYGPLAPALITVNRECERSAEQSDQDTGSSALSGLLDAIWRFSTPVKRKTVERRMKRRLSFIGHMEYYQRKRNLVACLECGYWHERHTLCANCYSKVQAETARIRAELPREFHYNMPAQELSIAYEKEAKLKEQILKSGRFAVSASGERPSWFPPQLLDKRRHSIRSGFIDKAAQKPL